MAEPVRHRQTKGAATDMFDLQPPRHISTLRILPIPVGAGERPFTERTAAARPWRREPLTLGADARHHARIGILGGEQRCTMPSRAPRAPSLSRNLR